MTNKTEMVSVPRDLPRELVEKVFMEWGGRCEYLWADFLEAIEKAGLLATPAEDVRAVVDEPRLTKKAKVGSVIFGEGIKESAVIRCAQRAYEFSQQPEVEAARLGRLKAALSHIHSGSPSAVGDEPVGYAQTKDLEKISGRRVVHVGVLMGPKLDDGFEPLYRRPQRPVVLPERKRSPLSAGDEGWNAYDDEVKRLNP